MFMHCTSSKSHLFMLQVSKSNLIGFSSYGPDKFWMKKNKKEKIDKNNMSPLLKGRHKNVYQTFIFHDSRGTDSGARSCPCNLFCETAIFL